MTDLPTSMTEGGREGLSWLELALWGAAGLVSLAAHVGGAAWVMREMPIEMADSAPPPSIMVELAPKPEAINTETNEISEQMENSLEVNSETVEPVEQPEEIVEQPTPEEIQPEQPVEEVTEAEPEPVEMLEPEPEPEPDTDPVEEQILPSLRTSRFPFPSSGRRRKRRNPSKSRNPRRRTWRRSRSAKNQPRHRRHPRKRWCRLRSRTATRRIRERRAWASAQCRPPSGNPGSWRIWSGASAIRPGHGRGESKARPMSASA